jgi:hypothetical protein
MVSDYRGFLIEEIPMFSFVTLRRRAPRLSRPAAHRRVRFESLERWLCLSALMIVWVAGDSAQSAPASLSEHVVEETTEAAQATVSDDPPEIVSFSTNVDGNNMLTVTGSVADEDPAGLTVVITFLEDQTDVTTDSHGDFTWQKQLEEEDEGWLDAFTQDRGGQESEIVRDYVAPVGGY